MPLTIIRHDITELEVDVIVSPINQEFLVDGGVCQVIFEKAGKEQLIQACQKLPPLKTSEAVITDGFKLRAKHIIHTIGPIYDSQKCVSLLEETYKNCLKLASENNLESIAFPLISSGLYGFPKEQALEIARKTITCYLKDNDLDVVLTIFDKESFAISENLLGEIESYISENYVEKTLHKSPTIRRKASFEELEEPTEFADLAEDYIVLEEKSIEDAIGNLDEPFSQSLLKLIDVKGKTDVEVYKKANIDRKLFSKIRTKKDYNPSKRTILALSISLELSLDETNTLLEKAGYVLSHSHKFDVIVEYFIVKEKYDIFEINEVLFKYDQALLGC